MSAVLKTEPAVVMVVPKMDKEGDALVWHGQFNVRAKGYSLSVEDREAMVMLLREAANQIEAGI